MKNVLKIGGAVINITDDTAKTEMTKFKSLEDVNKTIGKILAKRPKWKVKSVDYDTNEPDLKASLTFSTAGERPPRTKTYEVSWVEHCICSITVEAKNRKEALEIADNEFADSREYLERTELEVKEVSR